MSESDIENEGEIKHFLHCQTEHLQCTINEFCDLAIPLLHDVAVVLGHRFARFGGEQGDTAVSTQL